MTYVDGTGEMPGWAATGTRLATASSAVVVLAIAALAESVTRATVADASPQFTLALCVLALATTVPPALLRPAAAATAVTVASLLSLVLFQTLTVAGLLVAVAVLYRLGRSGVAAAATGLAAPFVVLALVRPGVVTVLLAALAPALGWAGAAGQARAEASGHRAARQAVADALVEHTARGERARIARELHDVVAHHISMIAVQVETARLTTPGLPEAGARRLSEIGDTARAGLTEMRRLLGVLREDADVEVAERAPQPGLGQLNELLDEARESAGAGVRLIVSGLPVPLDPGVELAAYRIIQEALTNARRHAPGAAVDVELRYTPEALLLRVRDNGPGSAAEPVGGNGLAGMRERAAAVGGRLRSGPAAVGGFLVEASLPAGAA
jgi:signal transduction histidine kinase